MTQNINQNSKEGIQKGAPCYINVAGLVGDSIVDGPGLRFAIFCQGCTHNCPGCHNPETQALEGGTRMNIDDIFENAKKYPLCKAITFSGGEPFQQAEAFFQLAKLFKQDKYELAAYSGYTYEQLLNGTPAQQALLRQLDTLIDGRFVLAQKNLKLRFKGSGNQRIINVQQSLAQNSVVLETSSRWTGESV